MNTIDIELPPLPVAEAYLYICGEHRGVSLNYRGDSDLSEGTRRISLITAEQADGRTRAAIKADRQRRGEPVGEAGTMPGTSGFTMACFSADEVPVGTLLYTVPHPTEEAFCKECGDGLVLHDPGICGTCYQTKYVSPQTNDWRIAAMGAVSHLDYESGAPSDVLQALRVLRAALNGQPYDTYLSDPLAPHPADQKQGTGNRLFAVACILGGTNKDGFVTSGTLSIREAESEQEAKGMAIEYALEQKPYLSVKDILVSEIHAPQPTEPVKVPSDDEILDIAHPHMGKVKADFGPGYLHCTGDPGLLSFARALLARYRGIAPQPAEPIGELAPTFPVEDSNMLGGVYRRGFFGGKGIPVYTSLTGDEPVKVLSDDEDYITEFLSEHADHNVEHGRMTFDKWTLRRAVRALIDRYGDIAPQPDEPVKVPSTEEMAEIWEEAHKPFGGAPFLMSHVEYSRALLNRYGHPATPEGWQLVPKEPSRKMVLTGEEAWDKHLDKRLEAQASKQPFVAYPSEETLELCSRVAYRAMLEAAPKFGEEE